MFASKRKKRRGSRHRPAAAPSGPPVFFRFHVGQVAGLLVACLSGVVFAAGLIWSGMTRPDKVIGFLDLKELFVGNFPGRWDPSLLFVVLGAVAIALLGYSLTPYASVKPWFARGFVLSTRRRVDVRLLIGALAFGVGLGLSGYSPSTALASLLTGQVDTAIFVLSMLGGMWVAEKMRHPRKLPGTRDR